MITKDPRTLKIHPLRAKLPAREEDEKTFVSFLDNFQAAGPDNIPPIIITGNLVIDGKRRLEAARRWAWKEIRCEETAPETAALIIAESLLGQRSMSRGVKLYYLFGIVHDYARAAEWRRLLNVRVGRPTKEIPSGLGAASNSQDKAIRAWMCEICGVSDDTWLMAVRVLKLFAEHPAVKEEWEPKMLSGERNLWNVISGQQGQATTKEKLRPVRSDNQLELFDSALEPLVSAVKPWGRIAKAEMENVLAHWREAAFRMPAEACETLGNIFLEVAKERLQAA